MRHGDYQLRRWDAWPIYGFGHAGMLFWSNRKKPDANKQWLHAVINDFILVDHLPPPFPAIG